MALIDQLKNRKDHLRNVVAPKEQKHINKLIFENDDDYQRLMRETYFENYYDLIEQYTFKSVIINLTPNEIKLLCEENVSYLRNPEDISTKHFASLSSIEKKIEEGIKAIRQKIKNPSANCFLRLSTRSPKDANIHMKDFPTVYHSKLEEVCELHQAGEVPSIYEKMMAFYLASTEVLSIWNGAQGVRLLVMSKRIQSDLKMCVERSESLNLIIREFVKFPVEYELRGFVWKNRLTALSQYNNLVFLPSLVQNTNEIEKKVKDFMDTFIDIMGVKLDSFVVDIVLDYENNVWVVELNPFGEISDGCLFSWVSDRELLLNEKGLFEFRIQEHPPELAYIKGELSATAVEFYEI